MEKKRIEAGKETISFEKGDEGQFYIIIKYQDIDLTKCTKQGLELMLDILLCQEQYERCAEVRNELNKRA